MVFLVLALTWAAVLTFWYRSRSQQAFPDSVVEFHHHLRVIERAAPGTRMAANRLRGPGAGPLAMSAIAAADGVLPRPAVPRTRRQTDEADRDAATARRRRLQRRRRDVLIVLAVLAVATLVLTLVDRIRDAAVAQIVSDVALGGYLVLLIRASHVSARRAPRRRRAARSLRRLRARPAAAVDGSAALYDPGVGGWDADGKWDAHGQWDADGQWVGDGQWDANGQWDESGQADADGPWSSGGDWELEDDDRDDDTAGFAAVTLRPAVGR